MGKTKKSKVRGAEGDDLLDSSDADSVGSSSTALSDLTISYATENVNSHEFVLDKYIDPLYEKSWGSVAFLYVRYNWKLLLVVYAQYSVAFPWISMCLCASLLV